MEDNMPFFTVVIPAYNRADLIGQTIESVLGQEFADFEMIVVDDGSSDDTVAVVRRYDDPRVRLLEQRNSGPGVARNLGAGHAAGRYVAFLDSDDLWFPWTLASYRHAISECGEPPGLFGSSFRFSKDSELQQSRRGPVAFDRYPDFLSARGAGFTYGSGSLVLRSDVMPMYCEDLDLLFRIGTGYEFVYVREPMLIAIRNHPGGTVGNIDRTYRGTCYLIGQEKAGRYPGSAWHRSERRQVLCHHIRGISTAFLAAGKDRAAWALYFKSFWWQLRFGRFKFLAGLPLSKLAPRLNPARRA
jgi:glycosyltransferase involved in cell wall biosynthesis